MVYRPSGPGGKDAACTTAPMVKNIVDARMLIIYQCTWGAVTMCLLSGCHIKSGLTVLIPVTTIATLVPAFAPAVAQLLIVAVYPASCDATIS
jgi:hypothetical protein